MKHRIGFRTTEVFSQELFKTRQAIWCLFCEVGNETVRSSGEGLSLPPITFAEVGNVHEMFRSSGEGLSLPSITFAEVGNVREMFSLSGEGLSFPLITFAEVGNVHEMFRLSGEGLSLSLITFAPSKHAPDRGSLKHFGFIGKSPI